MTAAPCKLIPNLLAEAQAHLQAGHLVRADSLCRQLLQHAPRDAAVYYLAGLLALRLQRPAEAITRLMTALRLSPDSAPAATLLATVLIDAGRAAEAEIMLAKTARLAPRSAGIVSALAHVQKLQGRVKEAASAYERATQLAPDSPDIWSNYGLTLASFGQNLRALQCHERALSLDPRFAPARFGRAQALHKIYRIEEALADYDACIRSGKLPAKNALLARSYRLFALQNSDTLSREALFAEHLAYGRAVGGTPAPRRAPLLAPDAPAPATPQRPLRLGILSPDLRTHSCAYFLEPILRHLDPREFELLLYHDSFTEDEVSARFKRMARVWRNFVGQSDAALERAIREDRPDILIDLTGHVGMTVRLPAFARRLAPVQITWLGYPDTTGVPAMDYRFTDAVADPPGDADRFNTEHLVRFSSVAWSWQPPDAAPDALAPVAPPPCLASAGASVTFGCFNSPTKFTDTLFAIWARLLAAVPGSRLLLKGRDLEDAGVRAHLFARMNRAGLPEERTELLPRTADTASHLALYKRVDIALDTFPYNGTTTTCESLWMGRPVITIGGDRHAARVSASLLTAIGRPEWIASCPDDYIRRAAALAAAPASLAAASAGLRSQMSASPLMDHAGQSARFAAALQACWRAVVHPANLL
ncbi:hypothetical protein Ga0100231_020365 [Opitutaceae bacterium TAV4]|nr:hypothetical protein Ga0100231_020365 [Opitutaceae bacterium TAV4]RRK00407.1 hypothetical protein Ga0100230_021175 [Opitutaceae bacterium TAV3]